MSNKALNRCRLATDNDEFYTLYEDIESEVKHYHSQLKGKTIYCKRPFTAIATILFNPTSSDILFVTSVLSD